MLTQRISKAQIDNLIATLADLTDSKIGYTHAYENQYQLYLEGSETGRIERTLGRVVQGNQQFYDCLYLALHVLRVYIQQKVIDY